MLLNPKRSATLHFRVSILSPLRHQSTMPPNPNPTTPLTKSQLKALVINRYSRGKFSDLIQNVVASPPVLLLACQNLTSRSNDVNSPAVASRFSVKELGRELGDNRFDVESCCIWDLRHCRASTASMNLQPAKNKQGVRRWFAGPPLRWQSQF